MKLTRYSVYIVIALFLTACGTKDIKKNLPNGIKESKKVESKVSSEIKPEKKVEETVPLKAPGEKKPEKVVEKKEPVKKEAVKTAPKKKLIRISGVGDIMMGTNFPEKPNYLPPNDGKDLLPGVKKFFKDSDIVFGNLEGPFLNKGETKKNCKNCYTFKVPEHYVSNLVDAGFNLLSVANNHAGDFGQEGRDKTAELLKKNKINFAGTIEIPYTIFTSGGVKYGFCAFSPNWGAPDIRDIKGAVKTVSMLSKSVDIVIVSFHGGAEGAKNRNITRKDEMFYGENRGNIYKFAHSVIDAGADIVFGHGPHITRAVELYRDRLIAYSLGNFCTFARFNILGLNGIAPILTVTVDKNGRFISGKIIPVIQKFRKGPVFDPEYGAVKEIIDLTKTDFPETPVVIDKDGNISKKPAKSGKADKKVKAD